MDIFVASTVSNKVSSEKMSGCSTFRGKLLRYLLSLLLLEPLVLRAADPEELQSSCSKNSDPRFVVALKGYINDNLSSILGLESESFMNAF